MEQTFVEKYKVFDLELMGTKEGNPFQDTDLSAEFTNGTVRMTVKGFYKADGRYGVRFMPGETGVWSYKVSSNDPDLDGTEGRFTCTEAGAENHGRVLLKKDILPKKEVNFYETEDEFHFAYEDGTRFQPFGTTCYAWINQAPEVQEETLRTLKSSPFNKVRMCIFPKYYTYNTEDPAAYAFAGNETEGFDFGQFSNDFFENLEHRISQLDELGIEADIILLHPYDKWGFSKMTREQDIFYLSYAARRLSAFKNIWWSLANEYDLLPQKSVEDWDTYARVIMENDPYGHLRSIHNCIPLYDHHKSWITHCSIQRTDVFKTSEMITEWRKEYRKPVIVDEVGYEGNIDCGWGSLTGEEITRRFWEGCLRGGYLSHGETYVDKGPQIWWAHGGRLYGTCTDRIAFLKEIMAEVPEDAAPLKLTPENHERNWDCTCLHDGEDFFLYYHGFFRPLYRNYQLPGGKKYEIEVIDTWNMTIEKLPGVYEGLVRVDLPARQYMAVRIRSIQHSESITAEMSHA